MFITGRLGIVIQLGYCVICYILVLLLHACSLACMSNITHNAIIVELSHLMINSVPLVIVLVGVVVCVIERGNCEFVTRFHYLCGFVSIIYLMTCVAHDVVETLEEKIVVSSCHVHHMDRLYLTIHAFKHTYVAVLTLLTIGFVHFIDSKCL
ncbi:hypothetical protein RF11_01769 [Thelohanellus kitauei]|uniref:Uncharacterized protein n=1 Tax=Thelohanellus kitauei TaxID=669202 RepID=A0A0C2JER6_THEKT|nr:hypothetical protein RF11_01769 [Thelohanellus kitauei]